MASEDRITAAANSVDTTIQHLNEMIDTLSQDETSAETSTLIQNQINELVHSYSEIEANSKDISDKVPVDAVCQLDSIESNSPNVYEKFLRDQYDKEEENIQQSKAQLLELVESLQRRMTGENKGENGLQKNEST
eukprot:gb/GECG01007300.1/.p1 GENE.gb/GECG01007300.1/~~gb/GECG01007300.1/.p1  ORF type:complete len:135 (+),score=34.02 gb/GECG01007300.1/:1-405(+)